MHLRLEPAGIVETRGGNTDERARVVAQPAGQPRSAPAAKAARVGLTVCARDRVAARTSFYKLEFFSTHQHRRHKRGAGCGLTIAAMAFEHHHRLAVTTVADVATGAAAFDGVGNR